MSKLTIKDRIIRSISMRQGEVVLRSDFEDMGSPAQVTRGLNELVRIGRIIRIGYGVFAKAKLSSISGKPVPRQTLEILTLETLKKLGASPIMGLAQEKFASGKTTQIPMKTVFNIGAKRITRKITVGNRTAIYENNYKSRA
jgi:hypothetical protein